MEVTVAVYEEREKTGLHWQTLGLGPLSARRSGHSAPKLRQRLVSDLRHAIRTAHPTELGVLDFPTGIKLHRLHLELRLRRHKVAGDFPLVVAPRRTGARERLLVAYHPMIQDDWFHVREDADLAEQATHFFRRLWFEASEDRVGYWVTGKHDRIRLLTFDVTPKSLADTLKKEERDLVHSGRRSLGSLRVLMEVGVPLSQRAADRTLAVGRPRSPYRQRLQELLGGSRKTSAVLVGAPGVGKTTLVHRFVDDLLEGDGYRVHSNLDKCQQVWQISGRRLIAGQSLYGQWEERVIDLLHEVRPRRIVLYVEDLHAFGRLGRTVSSNRSLADVFRAAVARREVHLLGELTPERLQALESDAPAFAAAFVAVPVEATGRDETLGMLLHEARLLEQRHAVKISVDTLRVVLETTETLFTTAALPGKALDLLGVLARRASSRLRMASEPAEIGPSDVLALISQRTGIPEVLLRTDRPLTARTVEERLQRNVLGQEQGIAAARDVILRIKTGLTAPRRPYGTLLFTGPTGTGKTELAKALANFLYGSAASGGTPGGGGRLIRLDMSEFNGPDAAARLVGDRIQPRGLLTTPIAEQPFAVVLLDEIEKAHPSVLNLLLQVMGDGRLTDTGGTVADFSHTVLVLTSNLGADGRARVGFEDDAGAAVSDVLQAVKAYFPPELFNRIDRVVPFRPLTPEVARGIARLEIKRLLNRRGLVERNVFVTTTEAVVERVVREGFHPEQGARSLKRYLEREIGGLLAEEIASQKAAEMRSLCIYVSSGQGSAKGKKVPFALHTESLREAVPGDEPASLENLLGRSADHLREELPAAWELVRSLSEGPELEEVATKMRAHLRDYEIGRRGIADRIFNLDVMRGVFADVADVLAAEVEALTPDEGEAWELDHFAVEVVKTNDEWSPIQRLRVFDRRAFDRGGGRLTRPELLALLAEVHFLRRALATVDDPRRHAAFVEVLRVSHGGGDRFAAPEEGLFDWLVSAYAAGRGELESAAWADATGTRGEGLPEVEGPDHAVLKLTGLSVLDSFLPEQGTHLRSSLSRPAEIVRVRVWPASAEESPLGVIEAHRAARQDFTRALEAAAGGELPANPDRLLPIVRRYDFEPPDDDRRAPCEVEDYVLSYAGTHRVRSLAEAVGVLRLLHQTAG